MLIDADGMIRSAYDKSFLIPFAEFVPFADRFAAWSRIAPTLSHFRAGVEPTALRLGQWRIATPICYETIRPAYVRKLVRRTHAHLLVSLTNDGWFGDSPEPRLHLALTRFRAIEHRRYLVRATNTGISAIVDPVGRVVAKTEIFQATSLTYPVRMLEGLTIYEELGDWPGYLAATVLILVFALRRHGVRS
jgi:apolipoprotein N-acyltransferase